MDESVSRRKALKRGFGALSAIALAGGSSVASAQATPTKEIVIYLYDGMTALDAIGPYEILRFLPNAGVRFVAKTKGPIRTDSRVLTLMADFGIADISSAHTLVIPGGGTTAAQMQDEAVVGWVRSLHATTTWTTSVCTGAGLLVAAGLLKGVKATTHWASMADLSDLGVNAVQERVVRAGKIITSAGVSAGMDMALALAALEAGDTQAKAIQLLLEYDPAPPFDSGSFAKADSQVKQKAIVMLAQNSRRANMK